jgi:hypothetical protein
MRTRIALLCLAISLLMFGMALNHPSAPLAMAAKICLLVAAAIFLAQLYRIDPPDDDWPPRGQSNDDPHNFPLNS